MSAAGKRTRFARLSSLDLMFLNLESREWPGHFGGLAVVDGKALMDSSARLRLPELADRLDHRLTRAPQLRRRLCFPGPLGGRPLWVDDHRFDIRHHLHETVVEPPGGDSQLLDAAARLYGQLLDRSRPLWELWFLTGLTEGRIGVLLKLHHSVADGLAAVAIMASLFDFEPDAPDPDTQPWTPERTPGWWSLVADNLSSKVGSAGRAPTKLGHPLRLISNARVEMRVVRDALDATAPRTSLNQVVRAGRRIRFIRVDLAEMKNAARAHGAKVNDVVLDIWAGGLRELMLHRGEPTSGIALMTNLPISLRSDGEPRTIDNEVGFIALPLPVGEPDVHKRLEFIVPITQKAKSDQHSGAMAGFLAFGSALPIGKYLAAHQHTVNLKCTNVAGPPVPVYMFGARILDILPITRLFGNVGLTLAAFSYAGKMYLVMTADAKAFPDLDVLMAGMEKDWHSLIGDRVPEAVQVN